MAALPAGEPRPAACRRRLLLPSPLKRCHLPQRGRPSVRSDLIPMLYPALSAQQTHVVSPLVPSESQSEATCGWLLSQRESQGDGVTRRRLLLPSPLKRCHLPQRGRPGVRADLFAKVSGKADIYVIDSLNCGGNGLRQRAYGYSYIKIMRTHNR